MIAFFQSSIWNQCKSTLPEGIEMEEYYGRRLDFYIECGVVNAYRQPFLACIWLIEWPKEADVYRLIRYIISLLPEWLYNFSGPGNSILLGYQFFCVGFYHLPRHLVQGSVIWVLFQNVFQMIFEPMVNPSVPFTHWNSAALIATVFPFFANQFGPATSSLSLRWWMVLAALWVSIQNAETKGRSSKKFTKEFLSHEQ